MTFQFRSLLPVVERLVAQGREVFIPQWGEFDPGAIRLKPTSVSGANDNALRFVASSIGMRDDFLGAIHWLPRFSLRRILNEAFRDYDLFLSTTKGFPWLAAHASRNKPQMAVPYENILDAYFFRGERNLPKNCPSHAGYERELREAFPGNHVLTGLPFMDLLCQKRAATTRRPGGYRVLFLHPGGWRGVVSDPGDDEPTCLRKQEALYRAILKCMPPGARLALKIHPLAALYHDAAANRPIAEKLGIEIAEGWLGDILFECDVVLSLGSSSLFEIVPFDIPYWVINYLSQARSQYYTEFSSIYVNTEEELRRVLAERAKPEWGSETEKSFLDRLHSTCDGNATERVMKVIDELTAH